MSPVGKRKNASASEFDSGCQDARKAYKVDYSNSVEWPVCGSGLYSHVSDEHAHLANQNPRGKLA